MAAAKPTLTAETKAHDAFSVLFEVRLKAIAQRRKDTRDAYPESVRALLHEISKPVSNGSVCALCGESGAVGKIAAPVFEWLSARHAELSNTLDGLWLYHLKNTNPDACQLPPEIQKAMRQEREFRFFGQFVQLAHRSSQGTKVPVAGPTVRALADFQTAAEKMLQANGALLRDTYLRRAISPQELPALRLLDQILPALTETFELLDVKSLYPVRNEDRSAFDRYVCVELSEMLLRCFGHANPSALAVIGKNPEIDVDASDPKWCADRIAEARRMAEKYNETRALMDFRYPLKWEEDLTRPLPGWSFWLGDNHAIA